MNSNYSNSPRRFKSVDRDDDDDDATLDVHALRLQPRSPKSDGSNRPNSPAWYKPTTPPSDYSGTPLHSGTPYKPTTPPSDYLGPGAPGRTLPRFNNSPSDEDTLPRFNNSPTDEDTPPRFNNSPDDEETAEERRRREEEESMELARALMAQEAMASYQQHFDLMRDTSQLSPEELEVWRAAMGEEEREQQEEEFGDEDDMSYETLLEIGDRIGDVKAERWAMIASSQISKLESFIYDKSANKHQSGGDDSKTKCLICQCEYEEGEVLRRLPCGHFFHQNDVDQWLLEKDHCPYCRVPIVDNSGN